MLYFIDLTLYVSYIISPRLNQINLTIYTLKFETFLLDLIFKKQNIPANICWSSRRLQHVFSVTIFRLPRRLEDALKTSRKMSWRRLGRQKIVTLKTSWRRLEDMSWRRLEDMSWRCLEDVLERNKMFTGDICI